MPASPIINAVLQKTKQGMSVAVQTGGHQCVWVKYPFQRCRQTPGMGAVESDVCVGGSVPVTGTGREEQDTCMMSSDQRRRAER